MPTSHVLKVVEQVLVKYTPRILAEVERRLERAPAPADPQAEKPQAEKSQPGEGEDLGGYAGYRPGKMVERARLAFDENKFGAAPPRSDAEMFATFREIGTKESTARRWFSHFTNTVNHRGQRRVKGDYHQGRGSSACPCPPAVVVGFN